jgi:hypothetical protein
MVMVRTTYAWCPAHGLLLCKDCKVVCIGVVGQQAYPNGRPMFAPDGMMLDDQGNRSIFDDVDE